MKCRGAGAIKADFPAVEELQEADANEFCGEREFVGVVGEEGRRVQGSGCGDVLDGDLVELFLFQEAFEGVVQELASPANTRIEPFAILVKHLSSQPPKVASIADQGRC